MYFSELYKLKRNSILVLTFSIIIVLGGISIIQGKASGKVSFNSLYELLIWNGFSLFIPMLSTLFTGYLINLEFTNDTYKNYMIVPIRMKEIIYIKVQKCTPEDKVECFQIAETFKAKVIDYGRDSLLLEFVQTGTKNDAVIKLMKEEFKSIEVVRGGSVGIESISMMER